MTENRLRLGIVGHGFVGKAVDYAFSTPLVDKFVVDPKYGTDISGLVAYQPNVTFVCAPTPMNEDSNNMSGNGYSKELKLDKDNEP